MVWASFPVLTIERRAATSVSDQLRVLYGARSVVITFLPSGPNTPPQASACSISSRHSDADEDRTPVERRLRRTLNPDPWPSRHVPPEMQRKAFSCQTISQAVRAYPNAHKAAIASRGTKAPETSSAGVVWLLWRWEGLSSSVIGTTSPQQASCSYRNSRA